MTYIRDLEIFDTLPTFEVNGTTQIYAGNVRGGDSVRVSLCECGRPKDAGTTHYVGLDLVRTCHVCGEHEDTEGAYLTQLENGAELCGACRRGEFRSRIADMVATGFGLAELCRVLTERTTLEPHRQGHRFTLEQSGGGLLHIAHRAPDGTRATITPHPIGDFRRDHRYRYATADQYAPVVVNPMRTRYIIGWLDPEQDPSDPLEFAFHEASDIEEVLAVLDPGYPADYCREGLR